MLNFLRTRPAEPLCANSNPIREPNFLLAEQVLRSYLQALIALIPNIP